MTQCWHTVADQRPKFSTILERLGYCSQDPDITAAPIPTLQRSFNENLMSVSYNSADSSKSYTNTMHPPEPMPTKGTVVPRSTYHFPQDKLILNVSGTGVLAGAYPPYRPQCSDSFQPLGSLKKSAGSASESPSDSLLVPSRAATTVITSSIAETPLEDDVFVGPPPQYTSYSTQQNTTGPL